MTTAAFEKMIEVSGINEIVHNQIVSHSGDLPSVSQLQRLRQLVLTGNSEKEVVDFLNSRGQRKKARKAWSLEIKEDFFNDWIRKNLIEPVMRTSETRGLQPCLNDLNITIRIPDFLMTEAPGQTDQLKLAIIRKVLQAFIDELLLLQVKLSYKISREEDREQWEVKCHDSN